MCIVTRTFIEKSNTIVKGDSVNLGMNPIMELYYGKDISRGLLYFDITKLQSLVADKTYPNVSKLKHVLKMQNVGGLSTPYRGIINKYNHAHRAQSFDLIFFKLNQQWDMGTGYDFVLDGYDTINRVYTTQGSNWYNSTNLTPWDFNGVYDIDNINSNIIAQQHFDIGNELIEVDITDYVNDLILGNEVNYGIGIAFLPEQECLELDELQYVGFFTQHTHTFFHPCIETRYDDVIKDDRVNFYLNKQNRLYFYSCVGGNMVNLDNIPSCEINGSDIAVKQATKGVYYVDVYFDSNNYEPETMYYDIWSNLYYNGRKIDDVELYFTTKSSSNYFSFGLPYETKKQEKIVPSIHGVNHKEKIIQGDVRKINVTCKIAYTTRQEKNVEDLMFRLYSKAGKGEIDVIDWTLINRGYNENYFMINTNEFVPGNYHIDIKLKHNMEEIIHRDVCDFYILNDKNDLQV